MDIVIHFAHHRKVVEEVFAAAVAVRIVKFDADRANVELVAERDVIDILAGLVLNQVDRIHRIENAVVAVPHKVVGVQPFEADGLGREGRVGDLEQNRVAAVVGRVLARNAEFVAGGQVVAEVGIEIHVDGRLVVFVTADGDDLLTGRQPPVLVDVVVEVGPVGGFEEVLQRIEFVKTVAEVVGELVADVAVEDEVEELAGEARYIIAYVILA